MSTPPAPAPEAPSPAPEAPSSPSAPTVTVTGEVTTTVHPELEAESSSDIDSSYPDSDVESDTTSLKSYVLNYQFENGRRYHAYQGGKYLLPNDETEMDRLDLTHHVMTIIQKGELHAAPLDNPHQILDIGTGTGIWAMEMADKYPSAIVTGNDLSPIQPKWVPPNVKFEVDDVEQEWTYPDNHFDFIYSRYMLGSIADWPKLISQAYKALKPGGYLEILEPSSYLRSHDNSLPEDAALLEWNKRFIEAAGKAGRSVVEASEYKQYILDAGFVDVRQDILKLPNAPWAKDKHYKEAGHYHLVTFLEAVEPLSLRLFTHVLGMSVEELHILIARVRNEIKNKNIHTHFDLFRYVARKPLG